MMTNKDTDMRFIRISTLMAAALLLLSACKGEGEQAAAQNPLLKHVPADTPYLFTNLEPTPREVVDAYLARFTPSLELAQSMLDDIQVEIHSDNPEHRQARLLIAVMNELDGKLNREGIESLGFSLESHKALYGMGAFPVLRFALKDAAALRATIGRIEAASGMTFPSVSTGDVEYWRLTDDGEQAGVYIAILDGHVAMSMFPAAAEAEFLPALLGQSMPPDPIDGGAMAAFNRDRGFGDYGSGYLDLQRMAAELLDGNSTTLSNLQGLHHFDPESLDPVCVAEVRNLVAQAPRLTMGTTELTANAIAIKFQLELNATLAGQLAGLVADVPVADDSTGTMFAAALGLRVGRLKDFLVGKATAVSDAPYQCDRFDGLNKAASDALAQLSQPMPPFIGNLNGFRLSLDEIDFDNPSPETARGMVSLEVEKPQMLVGMAQMFVPGVDQLGLEPGADPVELPEELLSMAVEGMHVYAAMSKDSIGIALGADQQAGLADFMAAAGDNDGTFFSVSYDMAAHMEFQGRMRERVMGMQEGDGAEAAQFEEMANTLKTLEAAYRDMLGRARLDMRFTPAGVEIENRMTFK